MLKRLFLFFLAVLLLVMSAGLPVFARSVPGDVNGDKQVTSTDYLLVKKVFGGISLSSSEESSADINKDGDVTSTDYLLLKSIFRGTLTEITPAPLPPQPAPSDDGKSFTYKVTSTISNNMVLQRNQHLNIWGTASKVGGIIYVELMGETRYAVVDSSGNWCVQMSAHPASTTPVTLRVYTKAQGAGKGYNFSNILLGDVWLISGQSNMQITLTGTLVNNTSFENTISTADNIRLFTQWFWDCENYWQDGFPVDSNKKYAPRTPRKAQTDVPAGRTWLVNNKTNAKAFSAIGYYFAKQVADHTNVPIGVIQMSAGGSSLCDFMPMDQYNASKHQMGASQFYPSDIYNSLIAPFSKTQVTGMLWYQGEADTAYYSRYASNLKDFVGMMRNIFGQDLYFYNVQLTSHNDKSNTWPNLADLRYAQFDAAKIIEDYDIVATLDYGSQSSDSDFAHPTNKKHIGDRLAYLALSQIYAPKTYTLSYYGSPTFTSATIKSGYAYLYFDNVGSGLKTANNSSSVKGFVNYSTGASLTATLSGTNCVKINIGSKKSIVIAYGNKSMADRSTCTLCNSNGIGALAFKVSISS